MSSQQNPIRLCRVSKKFLHSATRHPKDFGAWLVWQMQRRKHRRLKWHFYGRWIALLLSFVVFGVDYYLPETHDYLLYASIGMFGILIVYWSYLFLKWGWVSQIAGWRKFFNIDVWAGVTVILTCYAIFFPHHMTQFEFPASSFDFALLAAGIYLWILLRWGETEFIRHKLKSYFLQQEEYTWFDVQTTLDSLRNLDLIILLLGMGSVVSIGLMREFTTPYLISAALFPCVLPYSQWLMTWTLKVSNTHHYASSDFSFFRNLRNFKLFIFHQFGVITCGTMNIKDYIIDAHDEWNKDEIKDILFRITENSDHPIAQLIHEKFKSNKRSLVTIEKIDLKSHLGIHAEFKDLQGRQTIGILGGMTWHKVLQHEIFPETLVKLKEWKEKQYKVILLSLNRKILAMFALADPVRENWIDEVEDFKKAGLYPVMMSSNEDFFEITNGRHAFLERAVNLVPVERNEQKRYWLERESKALEVVSYWDRMDEPALPQIIFTPHRALVSRERSAFVAPRIQDLTGIVRLSRAHQIWRFVIVAFSFLLCFILASLLFF